MRSLALAMVLMLAACVAPGYDAVEYHLLATAKVNSTELMAHCDTITRAEIHSQLGLPLALATEQVRYRGNASDVLAADALMVGIIQRFEAQADARFSATYCKEKLMDIHDGLDRLMSAYAGLG